MSILVVGGDKIDKITQKLSDKGFDKIEHFDGRKKGQRKFKLPSQMDYILVITDFLNHAMMNQIKKQAKESDIPVIYSKRACYDLEILLDGETTLN